MDNNINFSENLQNHRGNSNDENLIEILPKVFKLPQIFKLDISSIGNKKWRKEGEKLSEYFNYGQFNSLLTLKASMKKFGRNTLTLS